MKTTSQKTSPLTDGALPAGMDARLVATVALFGVLGKAKAMDLAFEEAASPHTLSPADRALAYQMLITALRRKGGLEHVLARYLRGGFPSGAHWFRCALLIAATQILFMRTPDHAAVDLAVEFMKRLRGKEKGLAGLMNAVLRNLRKKKPPLRKQLYTGAAYDLPQWLAESWEQAYGAETRDAIAATLAREPMLDLTCRTEKDARLWADRLGATYLAGTSIRLPHQTVTALDGYDDGQWWVQDFSAHLPVTLMGDIDGKHVLDMCAAPGGKTLQLAAAGANVTALDRNKNRLNRLRENLDRTGLSAEIVVGDASVYQSETPVDHILLDAPCSATGTFRRNPDGLWTKGPDDVKKLSALQARCLAHAFSLLPVGGTLIYCVCSLEHAEGEGQVSAFLTATPDCQRRPISAAEVGDLAELVTASGDLLCLPSALAEHGHLDGFYAARLTRVATDSKK